MLHSEFRVFYFIYLFFFQFFIQWDLTDKHLPCSLSICIIIAVNRSYNIETAKQQHSAFPHSLFFFLQSHNDHYSLWMDGKHRWWSPRREIEGYALVGRRVIYTQSVFINSVCVCVCVASRQTSSSVRNERPGTSSVPILIFLLKCLIEVVGVYIIEVGSLNHSLALFFSNTEKRKSHTSSYSPPFSHFFSRDKC